MAQEYVDHLGLSGQPVRPGFAGEFPKSSDRLVERGKCEGIPRCDPCTCSQECLDAGCLPVKTSLMQRGIPGSIRCLDLRMVVEQQRDECQIAPACRRDQWRRTPRVSCFSVFPLIEQSVGLGWCSFSEGSMDRLLRAGCSCG